MYAIRIHGREVVADGYILVKDGQKFWIWDNGNVFFADDDPELNAGVLTFRTIAEVKKYMEQWKPQSFWCKPNGIYEIVKVVPVREVVRYVVPDRANNTVIVDDGLRR